MEYHRFRSTMGWLLFLTALSIGLVYSCEPVSERDEGEGDNKIPDYYQFFKKSFTLQLEMTQIQYNHTNYVKHSHYEKQSQEDPFATDSVAMHDEGSFVVYHYYPYQDSYIEQFDDSCVEASDEHPQYAPDGWFDKTADHGAVMYGPGAILRKTHSQRARYDGPEHMIGGMKTEKWYICDENNVEIELYFSQREAFDMPEKDMFSDDYTANRIPVCFVVMPPEQVNHAQYTVIDFVPELTHHANIETPRGLACEDKISLEPGKSVPNIPFHFSFGEEVIANPFIDGILFDRKQYIDKFELKYSVNLGMVRLDVTPPDHESQSEQVADKIIHDFNTGIQYLISRKYGKCSRTSLPPYSFDEISPGPGGIPFMAGPNAIFHLDDKYAYVGPRDTRHIEGELFTSTRKDIPDPEFEFMQNYPKAVLEYYFALGKETGQSNDILKSIPARGDLFLYNRTEDILLDGMTTFNIYDAREATFYTVDEYSVSECFDRHDDDWSTIYLFFPAGRIQFEAVKANEIEFKHHVYFYLLEIGDISPTRIGSIDVVDGQQGWFKNTSDTNYILTTVKLMERAPYFYGFKMADPPREVPGDDEIYEEVYHEEYCAELCSLEEDFGCKSFHLCDAPSPGEKRPCYLSAKKGAEGPQTKNYTCTHYLDARENRTFDDLPSWDVDHRLRIYISDKKFNFTMKFNDIDVIFTATEHIMFHTPDPMDPIKIQFYLYKKDHTITNPDAEFKLKANENTAAACEAACISWIDFDCNTIVHNGLSRACKLYADHITDINSTRIKIDMDAYIHMRAYLDNYNFMPGGVSINTTGPVIEHPNPELCAWECYLDGETACNSFEFCWDGPKPTCHLHVETFMDVSDGGNYTTHQKCIHFEKKAKEIFSRYPNEGMPNKNHKLVAQLTGIDACAKLCLEDSSETCQSYDFCTQCTGKDSDVCGDNKEGLDLCFIGDHHIGEPGLSLVKAPNCQHYSRDRFGDQDYASWIASQRKSHKPYTGGSMAGLAFGMIFLGIILAMGFLYVMSKSRPGTLPESISLGAVSSSSGGLSRSSGKDLSVNFGKAGGESDI